jgi:hypothetical protein
MTVVIFQVSLLKENNCMEEKVKSKINVSDYFVDGPSQKVLRKLKLGSGSDSSIVKKIIFFIIISWLPLLILSLIESTAINPSIKISFLLDFVIYIRVFAVIPLLFAAERILRLIIFKSLSHFIESGIVAGNNIEEYQVNLKYFGKHTDSGIINFIIIVIAYAIVIWGWSNIWKYYDMTSSLTSWQFSQNMKGQLSLSGYWYAFITIPIYLFFFSKLLWKFLLWAIILFKISKMHLNLFPTDPDRSGGLGFIGHNQVFFGILGFIQSSIFSAEIANKVLYSDMVIEDFKFIILGYVLLFTFILIFPMFFFVRKLSLTKLGGILDYGVASHKYVSGFHDKWVNGNNPEGEKLLGSADIQSLADLSNSYGIVKTMIPVPIDLRKVITLILIISVPFSPLILFVIPFNELFKALANFVF